MRKRYAEVFDMGDTEYTVMIASKGHAFISGVKGKFNNFIVRMEKRLVDDHGDDLEAIAETADLFLNSSSSSEDARFMKVVKKGSQGTYSFNVESESSLESTGKEIQKRIRDEVFKKLDDLVYNAMFEVVGGDGIEKSKPYHLPIRQLKDAWAVDYTSDTVDGTYKMLVILDQAGDEDRVLRFPNEISLSAEFMLEGTTKMNSKLLDIWSPDKPTRFHAGNVEKALEKLIKPFTKFDMRDIPEPPRASEEVTAEKSEELEAVMKDRLVEDAKRSVKKGWKPLYGVDDALLSIGHDIHNKFLRNQPRNLGPNAMKRVFKTLIKEGTAFMEGRKLLFDVDKLSTATVAKRMTEEEAEEILNQLDHEDIDFVLGHAVTRYDRLQEKRKFYNPNALGIYLQAVEEVVKDVKSGRGRDNVSIIRNYFLKPMVNSVIKNAGKLGKTILEKSDKYTQAYKLAKDIVKEFYNPQTNSLDFTLVNPMAQEFMDGILADKRLKGYDRKTVKVGPNKFTISIILPSRGSGMDARDKKALRELYSKVQKSSTESANKFPEDWDDFDVESHQSESKKILRSEIEKALGRIKGVDLGGNFFHDNDKPIIGFEFHGGHNFLEFSYRPWHYDPESYAVSIGEGEEEPLKVRFQYDGWEQIQNWDATKKGLDSRKLQKTIEKVMKSLLASASETESAKKIVLDADQMEDLIDRVKDKTKRNHHMEAHLDIAFNTEALDIYDELSELHKISMKKGYLDAPLFDTRNRLYDELKDHVLKNVEGGKLIWNAL